MNLMIIEIDTEFNSVILAIDPNKSQEVSLSNFLVELREDALNIAKLWHEMGHISGAFNPILKHVLGKYTPFQQYELKKLIRYYTIQCSN